MVCKGLARRQDMSKKVEKKRGVIYGALVGVAILACGASLWSIYQSYMRLDTGAFDAIINGLATLLLLGGAVLVLRALLLHSAAPQRRSRASMRAQRALRSAQDNKASAAAGINGADRPLRVAAGHAEHTQLASGIDYDSGDNESALTVTLGDFGWEDYDSDQQTPANTDMNEDSNFSVEQTVYTIDPMMEAALRRPATTGKVRACAG